MNNLIFVDCEASGPAPAVGRLTEIGAVHYPTRETYYGDLRTCLSHTDFELMYGSFEVWLKKLVPHGRPIFVSDNPAFDWQWINDGFWRYLGHNPFGHSARRLADFYAGLRGDFRQSQAWKRLRITPHDHNPVHDALGNLEAFERMLKGER